MSFGNRVGDTIRFGSSSRIYILGGPDELRPVEGLVPSAKAKLAALEHLAKMKEKDQEVRLLWGLERLRWLGRLLIGS